MLLYSQLQQVLIRNPPGPAISHLGQELSFPELRRRVGQLSFLYQKELGEDARVALLASPSPAFLAGFLAFTNIRAVAIPLDPGASLAELARWIKESDATHLAVTADRLSAARELLRGERLSLPVIEIERKQGGEFDQTFAPRPENTPRDHEPALVFRTAGVTEEPRLVTYTVRGLHHAAQALKTIYQAAPGERLCTTLPWSHPFAFLHGALFPVLTGLTCVTDPGKEGAELLQRLRDDKVTRLLLTAPGARQFLKDAAAGGRPPALRSLVVGPGATPGELTELRREAAAISLPILRAYGQSESAWAVAVEDGTGSRVPPGIKMKVLDPQGDELVGKKGIRRVGQLAISGPSLMSGYHISGSREDAERATKQVIRGTWLYTGDVAELTGESDTLRVRWAGRRADLLELRNSAAAADPYVAPDACDAILRAIPGVRDAAGFVLLDHRNRPQLAAVVVLEEGVPPRAEELLGACKSRLPAFQCPVGIVFAEFIPRGRLGGAVNRGRLSRQFHGTNLERPPTPVAEAEIAAPPPGFTACELVDLLVDVPLPLMIHAFFKGRMIPFRPAGTRIDRPLYDRLELKAARHLYVRDTELALLQEWRRQHDPDASGPAARARAPGLEQARRQAHRMAALTAVGRCDDGRAGSQRRGDFADGRREDIGHVRQGDDPAGDIA